MTDPAASPAAGDQEHPSPHRSNTSLLRLWSGLLLAPAAWFLQLCVDTPLLSQACYPRDEPYTGALPALMPAVLLVDAVALAAVLASLAIAWRNWLHTRREKAGRTHRVLASGDGRSRFMAMAGMLTSGLVATAVLYIGLVHLLLSGCGL